MPPPRAIAAVEQTEQLSQVIGRPLRFEALAPDEARAQLLSHYPAVMVEAMLLGAERQLAGAKSAMKGGVPELTGHPARSFRCWAADHVDAFV